MSPRPADPGIRAALVAAAARVLATEGPAALTTRRLAAEAGTSTMAVYTRFGSMEEVHRAVRADGFARLTARIAGLPAGGDPVADLVATAVTYLEAGVGDPHLYRVMFVDHPPPAAAGTDAKEDPGRSVFDLLTEHVRRCVDAGRFSRAEPALTAIWAAELWTMQHGMVTLAVSGTVPLEQVRHVLADMALRLVLGYGDAEESARASVHRGTQVENLSSAQ